MKPENEKFDLIGIAGLRPKKKSEADKKYAGFHRRMLAATIDSLLILILIAPLMDALFHYLYAPVAVDWLEMQRQMQAEPDRREAMRIFWRTMEETGFLARWLTNGAAQFIILGIATGLCWRLWAATPGKMIMGIRIVDARTEEPISDAQIVKRLVGYLVSAVFLCIGFFWISFDKRRQGWHDKIAHTVVVIVPRNKTSS